MNQVHKSTKSLKELRLKAGLTQHELADILEVRPKTTGSWERGESEPHIPVSKIVLLCKTFDCSLEELADAIEEAKAKSSNLPENHKVSENDVLVAA